MELSDSSLLDLIRFLESPELDCERVFDVLDQYAEIEIRTEDAARLLPFVHRHLETCSKCCDEYEALLDVLIKIQESEGNKNDRL